VIRNKKEDVPFLSSHEEKRRLILAHSAARKPLDPIQRMSLWAGVAICLVFVAGAWAYTVGSGIRRSLASSTDPNLQDVLDSGDEFRSALSQGTKDGSGLIGDLRRVTNQLTTKLTQDAVVDRVIEQLNASSTTSTLRNPFLSTVTSSQPTSSTVDSQ
jgi:hypothetical protein